MQTLYCLTVLTARTNVQLYGLLDFSDASAGMFVMQYPVWQQPYLIGSYQSLSMHVLTAASQVQ